MRKNYNNIYCYVKFKIILELLLIIVLIIYNIKLSKINNNNK